MAHNPIVLGSKRRSKHPGARTKKRTRSFHRLLDLRARWALSAPPRGRQLYLQCRKIIIVHARLCITQRLPFQRTFNDAAIVARPSPLNYITPNHTS